MAKLLSVLLAISAISACSSTPELTYVTIQCRVPERPILPAIDAGELWDAIGQERYDALMTRERRIVDWALELEAVLTEVCR